MFSHLSLCICNELLHPPSAARLIKVGLSVHCLPHLALHLYVTSSAGSASMAPMERRCLCARTYQRDAFFVTIKGTHCLLYLALHLHVNSIVSSSAACRKCLPPQRLPQKKQFSIKGAHCSLTSRCICAMNSEVSTLTAPRKRGCQRKCTLKKWAIRCPIQRCIYLLCYLKFQIFTSAA